MDCHVSMRAAELALAGSAIDRQFRAPNQTSSWLATADPLASLRDRARRRTSLRAGGSLASCGACCSRSNLTIRQCSPPRSACWWSSASSRAGFRRGGRSESIPSWRSAWKGDGFDREASCLGRRFPLGPLVSPKASSAVRLDQAAFVLSPILPLLGMPGLVLRPRHRVSPQRATSRCRPFGRLPRRTVRATFQAAERRRPVMCM